MICAKYRQGGGGQFPVIPGNPLYFPVRRGMNSRFAVPGTSLQAIAYKGIFDDWSTDFPRPNRFFPGYSRQNRECGGAKAARSCTLVLA
jgi:hypothetical protein